MENTQEAEMLERNRQMLNQVVSSFMHKVSERKRGGMIDREDMLQEVTLCFLLETLCGVSVADATIDYELTSFSPVGPRTRSRESVQPFALVVRTMNTFPGETFADKVAYWAENVAGLSKSEIAAIRANLVR